MDMKPFSWDFITYFLIANTVISMIRIIIGPSSADRLIGLNMVAAQVLAILVIIAVKEALIVYFDVALVYDIFGFVGILAITRYLGRRKQS
mgnify:CR=1 FL=1